MKIAVVGGGSTYTPELVDGMATMDGLTDLVLVDPAADRLRVVGEFSRRILRRHGSPVRLTWTGDLDAGLDGAGVVIIQLRVGGQAARITDETFPLDSGCVGQETTGAGGLAKALRTVPVVRDVARRASPDAWIVNFTNPVGIITRALLDAGHRAVGLCNVAIGFQRRFAALLGVAPSAVALDHIGLNHLTWERAAYVDGVDRLPALLEYHLDELAAEVRLPSALLSTLGCVPSYYLRYFYAHDEAVKEARSGPPRGRQVAGIEAELLELYADPALDTKPDLLMRRGGAYYSEAAVGLITSLLRGDGASHPVNVRNNGTFAFIPDEAVIEVMCRVDAGGAVPLPTTAAGPLLSGLIASVSGYEQLALDAAVHGGRSRVYQALLAHPLVGQHDLATELADRLIAANTAHLAWAR